MNIKNLFLGALVASAALAISPAYAKATSHWGKIKSVEAVVMQVETSDNPSDADWNILIRPASPEKSADFWKHFWKPSNQEWVDDTLGPAFAEAKGKFSAECRQCAGTGSDGAGCNIREGVQYDTNPCPRFFGCSACLYDLSRLSDTALEDLAVKAELFFGQDATPFPGGMYTGIDGKNYLASNDLNFRLSDTLYNLGFRDTQGRRYTDEGEVCDELSWNKNANRYDRVAGSSVCGQTLWVSGLVSHDEEHDYRPEVHPVYSITLDKGMVGNNTHAVNVGTFLDGSMDYWAAWWAWDYHKDGQANMPPSATLDFGSAPYQPSKPLNHCVYTDPGSGRCDLWEPECSVDNLTSFNVKSASLAPVTDRCGQQKVDMDWYAINGAAWVSKARLGWQQKDYSFVVSAKRMEPYGGILATEPPLNYTPLKQPARAIEAKPARSIIEKDRTPMTAGGLQVAKIDPAVFASLFAPACEVPSAPPTLGKLKRWYRWKVHAKASFPNVSANTLSWQWRKPTQTSKFNPEPPAGVVQPGYDFEVWMPAPSFDSPPYTPSYEGSLRGGISLNGKELVWQTEALEVTPPSVTIGTRDAKLEQGTVFSVQLTANTLRLCGNPSKFKYEWTRDLSQVAKWTGPGPYPVTLKPGEKTIIGVVVTDEFGVESAVDEQVLIAPQLKVNTEVACGDTGTAINERMPPGWPQPSQQLGSATLCTNTQIKASASALPHGADIVFPESSVGTVTYTWADVKVATDNSGSSWQPVPANWKVSYESPSNRTMTIKPDKQTFFYFQASVTATDQYGRTATAHVTGSNDFTSIKDLVVRLTRLYPVWRPGKLPPDPTGCMGDCAFGPDSLDSAVAVFLSDARAANPANARAAAALRTQFHQLSQFAFAKISAERKLPFNRLAKPVFTVRETSLRPVRMELLDKARQESFQRLNQKMRVTP